MAEFLKDNDIIGECRNSIEFAIFLALPAEDA
jgi:hypothetical protein